MKIVFVLHDLSLTGAPKIGIDMAAIMARNHDVYVVSKKDGPLLKFANDENFEDVRVIPTSHEYEKTSLRSRVRQYEDYLEEIEPDYVYVNSVAAADWATACRVRNIRFAVHSHEMSVDIRSLAMIGLFQASDIAAAHLIISASEECARDTRNELQLQSRTIYNFGVGIDCSVVAQKSAENLPQAVNAYGENLDWDGSQSIDRKRVVMCGVACERKGSDMFWELARRCPDLDFLWVGPWADDVGSGINPALLLNQKNHLPNLYWTNMLSNPYPAIKAADLFMLSSRDDPNPLVVPEAMSLGLPVCTFTDTGGSRIWTERFGFSMAGRIDVARMEGFVRRFFGQGGGGYDLPSQFQQEADIHKKVDDLIALITTC